MKPTKCPAREKNEARKAKKRGGVKGEARQGISYAISFSYNMNSRKGKNEAGCNFE